MTDIQKLVHELDIELTDVTTRDIRKVIDYLHSRGYLGGVPEWQPIETALKDCCIDTIGTIQTHDGKKVKVRVTDDYMSANSPYPLTTTYFEHPNGLTGNYTREAWMPIPPAPKGENK
jgi:hypothetical protein